jgi:hypothetical protein
MTGYKWLTTRIGPASACLLGVSYTVSSSRGWQRLRRQGPGTSPSIEAVCYLSDARCLEMNEVVKRPLFADACGWSNDIRTPIAPR